jgi:transposase
MQLTQIHLEVISKYLPTPRKPRQNTLLTLNAILYVVENGCKWRSLPSEFGNWHSIYVCFNRWSKGGVLERIFEGLQVENIIEIETKIRFLDSMSVCVHPNGAGALKSSGKQSIGRSKGGSQQKFIWFVRPPKMR